MQPAPEPISRRYWLRAALAVLAAAVLPAFARGHGKSIRKIAKAVAHYQDRPKTGKMCGMCRFFIAPGATSPGNGMMGAGGMTGSGNMMDQGDMMREGSCQLVAGAISPMGYCQLYQPLQRK